MSRRRLDDEMVARKLAADRSEAERTIHSRRVRVDGSPALKPGTMVSGSSAITIADTPRRFVSRGGDKLDGALEDLEIDVTSGVCLDAGAGSGGFTDCLLQRGAASVVAVDVGYGQFDWSLRNDPRVTLIERTNIRVAEATDLGGPFDVIVADLSFTSLTAMFPMFSAVSKPGAHWILLVKPQFEAARADVPSGGVVADPQVWRKSILKVIEAAGRAGAPVGMAVASRLKGGEGNTEFFVSATFGDSADVSDPAQLADAAIGSVR